MDIFREFISSGALMDWCTKKVSSSEQVHKLNKVSDLNNEQSNSSAGLKTSKKHFQQL